MKNLTYEEKATIYDTMVSLGSWSKFFRNNPSKQERNENIIILFNDENEAENILYIYSRINENIPPQIKILLDIK